MSNAMEQASVRDSAHAVMKVIEEWGDDADKLRRGLLEATRPLRQRADLLQLGAKRPANHIDNSRYLYYDGQISITLDQMPKGKQIPPHDHGIWEALVICRGRLHHAVYERADDGTVEGHAELKSLEDRELGPDEVALVVPPSEIHSFKALEDDTYVITVVGGNYSPTRHYYNVEKQTYVVATPGAYKKTGALS